ncbi:hypothetical protein [Microbispora oryzae]|uniref:hypothetical protein n=1 Tax=Microbispora oryzae TaxID=2806554 RepID=UPI001AEC3480|nr:hypothetical protein [Microbispora oryzae]
MTINQAEYRRLTQSPAGPVVRQAERIGRRTVNGAKRNVRVDDGHLRSTISHTVAVLPGRVLMRAGSPLDYGLYLHEGTGIYGPKHRVIRPVQAKALRFEVKEAVGKVSAKGRRPVVFALYVRGVKGDKWLVRAFKDACPYPVRER